MKILCVCQYYAPEPFRIPDICRGLTERGHSVTVVTGTPNYPEGEIYPGYGKGRHQDEIIDGVRVHRCPLIPRKKGAFYRFLNYYSFVFSAGRYLKGLKEEFDVVFINQLSPVMMAQPALQWAKRNRKKSVLYCLDLWPASLLAGGIRESSPIHRVFLGISRRIYRKADTIAVSSHGFLSYFQDVLGIDASQIRYLPQYAEALFDDLSRTPGKKEGADFVFAGNVGTMQSVETIVEAARLLQENPDIRIHVVGSGIALDHCRQLAQGLSNITFYGRHPLEEMPGFYAMADAMLVTMAKDPVMDINFPGKVQSYMAAGKAILGAVDGETARMIHEADCGICVPAGDANALAKAMETAAADLSAWEQYGVNAKKYYLENFRREGFLDSLEQLLRENAEP